MGKRPNKLRAYNTTIIILLIIIMYQVSPSLFSKLKLIQDRAEIIVTAESKDYDNVIRDDEKLNELKEKIYNLSEKEQFTYMYIDEANDEGTMNYYRLRYLLLPQKSVKYQYYGYIDFNDKLYSDLIKQFSVDYIFIHKDNGILRYLGIEGEKDAVIKIKYKNADNLFSQING
ncbi:hypothetical protein [Paenibacillus sp. NRS-1780]|uniref:hypothetical protein n=1 Tax=Paenibacillus sp. NRS-1780 TaxID=3233904 RepID=UPI003D296086